MAVTYEPIATQTLGAAAAAITFSSIPATYTDLKVILSYTPTAALRTRIGVNNAVTGIYSVTTLNGDGATAVGQTSINQTYVNTNNSNETGQQFLEIDIFSYASTSTNKGILSRCSIDNNGSGRTSVAAGQWRSTAAITVVNLNASASTFAAGAVATLYGIKAA
jgi:hypothetical protein